MLRDKNVIFTLCAGIALGFGFSHLILQENNMPEKVQLQEILNYIRDGSPEHGVEEALKNASGSNLEVSHHSSQEQARITDGPKAERLAEKVRVLCWVMTNPENNSIKAVHVKNTWGKRCNKVLFMSSQPNEELGTVVLPNVEEGTGWLWAKTKEAFKYIWEHHRDEADWFMKADDDTYVIMENLRYMLKDFDTNQPVYYGLLLKAFVNQGYMTGGAGYVLSKEAFRRFIEEALPDKDKCRESHEGGEDLEMGKCMEAVGVEVGDTRDALNRNRFMEFPPERQVPPGISQDWYGTWTMFGQKDGMECCSDLPISFHRVLPNQMDGLEYLIYHVRLYGVSRDYDWTQEPKLNKAAESEDKTPS